MSLSLQTATTQWLAEYVRVHRAAQSYRLAQTRVDRYFLAFFDATRALDTLTKADLQRYRAWLTKQGIALQTQAHVLADARCFLRWAADIGLLDREPIPRRLLPRIPDRLPDRLTDDEVARLITIPDPHGRIVRFGLATGLRWGEMTRARTQDIQNGVLLVGQTKSGRVRRIPLPPGMLAELRSHVGRIVPVSSSASFTKAVRAKSGVARFHPHQLRHTFACRWMEDGGSVAALKEILGHQSITTTERYARLSDDMVKREAERLYGKEASVQGG